MKEDHYYHNEVHVPVEDIALTVSVETTESQSQTWNDGRRVVELGVLAKELRCEKCQLDLHLSDIVGEKRYN